MAITATELKNNLSHYLRLAATEDIDITKNGKIIARLTAPLQDRLRLVDTLYGSLPAEPAEEAAREERLDTL